MWWSPRRRGRQPKLPPTISATSAPSRTEEAGTGVFAVTAMDAINITGDNVVIERKDGAAAYAIVQVAEWADGAWQDDGPFTNAVTYLYHLARRTNGVTGDDSNVEEVVYADDTTKTEAGTGVFAITATGAIGLTEYTATEAGTGVFAITATGAIGLTEYAATEAGTGVFAVTATAEIGVTEYTATEAGTGTLAITASAAAMVVNVMAGTGVFAVTAYGCLDSDCGRSRYGRLRHHRHRRDRGVRSHLQRSRHGRLRASLPPLRSG